VTDSCQKGSNNQTEVIDGVHLRSLFDRRIGLEDLIDDDVSPTGSRFIDDIDLGLLSVKLCDLP
jgi:hypothetical protein